MHTWIVVAADGCTDQTVLNATAVLDGMGAVSIGDWRQVGSARRAGVDAGLAHLAQLGVDATNTWIANTDADCEVPRDWLIGQLGHADRGADVVLGVVTVDNFDEHPVGVEARFTHGYVVRDDGTHDHVHGANFGVRADCYAAAGGWPSISVSEDHELTMGLVTIGATIVRTIDVSVTTSGRRRGRAAGGFADLLGELGASA